MMARLIMMVLVCCWCTPAQAHKPSDSYLSLDVQGQTIAGQWDIALRDLDFAIGLDGNGDGALTWDEIRARHGQIAAWALQHLKITSEAGPCQLQAGRQLIDQHTDGAYNVLHFQASCPGNAAAARLDISYTLLAELDPQHKGLLKLSHEGQVQTAIFEPDHARQSLSLISLPSRLVESAIAASVVLAALNNVLPLFRGRRPVAAFVFGLIHGFGFASVLRDLGLPQSALATSLFGFNVGVEIGQLAIVAVFLPVAWLLRKTWFYRQLMTWGSLAIALVAAVWLLERLADIRLIS